MSQRIVLQQSSKILHKTSTLIMTCLYETMPQITSFRTFIVKPVYQTDSVREDLRDLADPIF
ncbi:hypothetical protein CSB45_05830 [candidate division KSB3 bacterium]|uniref:Uncharacterized protein n=1 Tax=candidate division KSB3 bacterium TaxID=2044937 RepID=A0A2G6E6M3_9BACT|nr:MAG: hypothetical protein CSB45_05830 [candidate division KSB3 bacterium]